MLIVLVILTICSILVLFIAYMNDYKWISTFVESFLIILLVLNLLCVCGVFCCGLIGINADEKIEMYEKENKKIETQISELVEKYMNYEDKTLKQLKIESSMTLITLYPELKSDKLVQTEIETYTNNNNKIKKLKEEKIDRKIYKWLLYFGG